MLTAIETTNIEEDDNVEILYLMYVTEIVWTLKSREPEWITHWPDPDKLGMGPKIAQTKFH